MLVTITGDQILGSVGLPAADEVDQQWADQSALAASAFANRLPVVKRLGTADPVPDDVVQGALMLGANLYRRRPAGLLTGSESDPMVSAAVDNTVSRLLQLGYYQKPVFG